MYVTEVVPPSESLAFDVCDYVVTRCTCGTVMFTFEGRAGDVHR